MISPGRPRVSKGKNAQRESAPSDAPDDATLQPALAALHDLARTGKVETAMAYPVLLAPAWHEHLRRLDGTAATARLLEKLAGFAEQLRSQPWPFGMGPLDALFMEVKEGHSAPARALELAAAPELSRCLSGTYVARMAIVAQGFARKGEWQDGVGLGRLVLAAVDARRGRVDFEQAAMEYAATVHWLEVVTRAVSDVPDPRLFHDARTRGERLADVIHDPRGFGDPADMMFGLGVLHLDPYVGGRTNNQYSAQIEAWRGRFRVALAAENDALDSGQAPMPEPVDAVGRAADWMDRAARHRAGEALGRARKAQVQALVWGRFLGAKTERATVERVAAEALRVLGTPELQGLHTDVGNMLGWFRRMEGVAEDAGRDTTAAALPAQVEQLLAAPIPEGLEGQALHELLDQHLQTAFAIQAGAPVQAFRLWQHTQPLGRRLGSEQRYQFFQQGMALLHRAFGPTLSEPGPAGLRAEFERQQSHPHRDPWVHAARLLALALHATSLDLEEEAVAMVDAASRVDGGFASGCPELLPLARASLLLGAGVNRYNAGEFDAAADLYMKCAGAFLDCDDPSRAMEAVERVLDIGLHRSPDAHARFVVEMRSIAPRLERATDGAAEHLQRLYRQALASMTESGRMSLLLYQLFLEVAKGATFGHALLEGGPRQWLVSDECRELEQRMALLVADGGAEAPSETTGHDFETVLTAFVGSQEQAGGATPAERLRNLRILFETRMEHAQRGRAPEHRWIVSEDSLQRALGERSALLSLYFGHGHTGNARVFLMLLTREQTFFAQGELAGWGSNLMTMSTGGQQVSLSPFALGVSSLRRSIQDDPLTRVVSPQAAKQLLLEEQQMLGGGIREALTKLLAAGKDHLYVWPHGPYHFAPFHLFGSEGAPLAQEWTVTYLSNLNLLDPARNWRAPLAEFIAIGLDFPEGNARGLAPIPDAEAEALEVTAAMQAPRALTGAAIDKRALLDALAAHRRIHIATHGDLAVSSAAFQCLYLSTDPAGDVLYAYEIQRLDLKGVDLVTLSACETALGRFDIGDNLRGLPASLLAAGVSTIVGTLWPVETGCARHFFVRLYTELADGASKASAFRQAQLSTRRVYPQYRDWGAFYLTGAID